MVRAIKEDDLSAAIRVRPRLVEDAKPDSLWQLAMLAGLGTRVPLRPELLSYEVPAYYGMICAAYRPERR